MNTILIIEDQPPMRRNLALMLELEGYSVRTADNGAKGLELARAQTPDLILCDVMMPEMDGHTVLQSLRADPRTATVPLIFLTARADKADVRIGMNFGADDYLTKPVSRDDLLAAVHARLARADAVNSVIEAAKAGGGGAPDFSSPEPLRDAFGLTHRESEVLLWTAQGKSNADIGIILGMSEKTVKQHLGVVFQKMGVESRTAASVRAFEILSGNKKA
jgi:DNA-binding NarL/FixJ family response regulator